MMKMSAYRSTAWSRKSPRLLWTFISRATAPSMASQNALSATAITPQRSRFCQKRIPAAADATRAAMVKKFGVSRHLIAIATSGSKYTLTWERYWSSVISGHLKKFRPVDIPKAGRDGAPVKSFNLVCAIPRVTAGGVQFEDR